MKSTGYLNLYHSHHPTDILLHTTLFKCTHYIGTHHTSLIVTYYQSLHLPFNIFTNQSIMSNQNKINCCPRSLRTLLFSILVTYFVSTQINHQASNTIVSAKKIDRNAPHGHKGILSSYKPGPFDTILDASDEKDLSKGNPVMKQLPGDDGDELAGKAICIQDVAAPKKAVWNQILDLNSYKGKVKSLKECKNYVFKVNPSEGTVNIKTKMVIGVMPGYSVCNIIL